MSLVMNKKQKNQLASHPAGIYMFKVNYRNTRKRCEICSQLTIKTPERRHQRRSGVFIVNFKHRPFSFVSIVNFEQVNACQLQFSPGKRLQKKKMDSSLSLHLPKIFQRLMDHFLENQVIHSTIKFFMFQNHVNTGSNAQ